MEPRFAGSVTVIDDCRTAIADRSSRRITCQYASRTPSALATMTNTSSTKTARARESVRPSMAGRVSLAGGNDGRLGQRPQPRLDGELADRGRLAQPVQLVAEVARARLEPLLLRREAADLVAGGRHPDVLGQREERTRERDRDRGEEDGHPGRSPARAHRGPNAAARHRRGHGGPDVDPRPARQDDGALACTLIDGHPLLADRVLESRRARVEERESVAHGVQLGGVHRQVHGLGLVLALAALVQLVLTAAVRLAPVALVTLAHGTPPAANGGPARAGCRRADLGAPRRSGGWVLLVLRPRDARRPGDGHCGRAGWHRSRRRW